MIYKILFIYQNTFKKNSIDFNQINLIIMLKNKEKCSVTSENFFGEHKNKTTINNLKKFTSISRINSAIEINNKRIIFNQSPKIFSGKLRENIQKNNNNTQTKSKNNL